ncbi:TPA: hypothetical protein NJY08_004872 [Salmonella enterica subsp. enterica serovar Typhi str. AG3]|nr:hypothetical protein [Salmonella enterica subsp. enterica serovar Typhi str. AG3]
MNSLLNTKIKEVKRNRLARSLRVKFGRRDFGFEWTDFHTAYFDGKTIFVKYDIQDTKRSYSEAEKHIVHLGFSYHEMGHKLYDVVDDFREWVSAHSSSNNTDWETNTKWPKDITHKWGNVGLDGRIESFLKVQYPFTEKELDFVNYEWAVIASDEDERGKSKYDDFIEMFYRRCLGMEELEGWCTESIELMDQHQSIIDQAKKQLTTVQCLDFMLQHLKEVWPTLLEWLNEEGRAPESSSPYKRMDSLDDTEWADQDTAEQNAQQVLAILQPSGSPSNESKPSDEEQQGESSKNDSEPKNEQNNEVQEEESRPKKPNFRLLIKNAEKEVTSSVEEAEEELAEQGERQLQVLTTFNNVAINSKVIESDPPQQNEALFDRMAEENNRQIVMLGKALQTILAPIPDEVSYHQRRGKLNTNRAWRATNCNDINIRTKRTPGTPSEDASISVMVDVSGSTDSQCGEGRTVLYEMQEALSVVLTAAHKIKLPSKAFAFTSDWDNTTHIYRLKSNDRKFTTSHKGNIGGLQSSYGNRDVTALQFLLDDVEKRGESIRLAFMISDGAPNFYGDENEETIKQMVKVADKKGIDVFCIFVGNDDHGYECAKRMYGERVIRSRNGVARDLKKHLIKILAIRRGL